MSFGCLYGSFSQERYVRVAKAVTEDSEQVGDVIPEFGFTTLGVGDWTGTTGTPLTTSVPADGFVAWDSFEDAHLTPSAYGEVGAATSGYKAFMPGFSQFVIAEMGPRIAGRFPLDFGAQGRFGPWKTNDDPNSAQWSLVDVTCLNGVGERVNVSRDADTGGVDFSQVAPASFPAALIPRRAGGRRVLLVVHPHEGHARQRSPRILRVTARVRLVERPPHPGPRPLQRGDGRLRS